MFCHVIYGDLLEVDPTQLQVMKKLPLNPYSFRIGLAFTYWLFELPLNVKITTLLLLLWPVLLLLWPVLLLLWPVLLLLWPVLLISPVLLLILLAKIIDVAITAVTKIIMIIL